MEKKCNKYKELFIFKSTPELEEHTNSCIDCKNEALELEKISQIIQEAKPLYFKQKKEKRAILAACALFLVTFSTCTFVTLNFDTSLAQQIKYGQVLTAQDYGFPVDSYGLIQVDE